MVCASGEEMNELEVGAIRWTQRESGKCNEDCCIFVDFCSGTCNQQCVSQVAVERRRNGGQSNLWVYRPRSSTACWRIASF